MYKVLLGTGSQKNAEAFSALIAEALEDVTVTVFSGGSRGELSLRESRYDLVIINTPLADGSGIGFAVRAASAEGYAVILITDAGTCEKTGRDLERQGIIVMKRPVEKKSLSRAVKDGAILSRQISALKKKNSELQEVIEESKLISRAKGMLMSHLNMTEAQAHRYIEKQAMDLRLSRKTVSENILKTYYNK